MRPTSRCLLLALLCAGWLAQGVAPARSANERAMQYSDNGHPVLDPAAASTLRLNDERLIVSLLDCLTVLDPRTGKAGPGAAERWEVSGDRRTWTFHLRKSAVWSNGSPVTAKDFVRSWTRVLDPFTRSPWTSLFRPIKGCAVITDNSARTEGFAKLRDGLQELKNANPNGIPGAQLILLMEETGVRPFLAEVKSRSVSLMLGWKEADLFPPELVEKTVDALRKERKRVKDLWEQEYEQFGRAGSGVHARDEHTLVVQTVGDADFLPELVARGPFAPLPKDLEEKRDTFFSAENYLCNGPFVLKGRGARPPDNEPEKRVLSVVHLERNARYDGPAPAQLDEIRCYTDQGQDFKEDVGQFTAGKLQWVNVTWPDGVPAKPATVREGLEATPGFTTRDAPLVLFLRFRCDKPPFQDKAARRAFALTIDRKAIAEQFWPKAVPADRMVPPGIEGRAEGLACPATDVAAAKAALKTSGVDSETWVELSYGEGPGQDVAAGLMIRSWKKELGVEPGTRIESVQDVRKVLRAGKFYAMISVLRGAVNDPFAYLAPLHSADVDSGHGWRDAATDALLDAARDPDVALADPAAWLKTVGQPELSATLDGAKGSAAARARFRQDVLVAAERRLMEEFVVVPLVYLREATLLKGLSGLGEDLAWSNPGFVGSLRSAMR